MDNKNNEDKNFVLNMKFSGVKESGKFEFGLPKFLIFSKILVITKNYWEINLL